MPFPLPQALGGPLSTPSRGPQSLGGKCIAACPTSREAEDVFLVGTHPYTPNIYTYMGLTTEITDRHAEQSQEHRVDSSGGFYAWMMGLMALLGQPWEGPGQGVPSSEPLLWVPACLWDSLLSWARAAGPLMC